MLIRTKLLDLHGNPVTLKVQASHAAVKFDGSVTIECKDGTSIEISLDEAVVIRDTLINALQRRILPVF